MIYLLAKYTLLFLLAAFFGFILGYWFSRRNIEDVTNSFEDLRKANQRSDDQNWERLWRHLQEIPAPKETDLSDVYKRIDVVAAAVSQLPRPEPVNLQPLVDNLYKLEKDIKAIPVPEKPARVDLSPVTGKIDALQVALRGIPKPVPPRDVDLEPVRNHIQSLEERVKSIPQPQAIDLEPVDRRLQKIEAELAGLKIRAIQSTQAQPAKRSEPSRAPRQTSRDEPRILKAALYGKKDNLKLISGVGPKLEMLLNENGVYYFWQVAEWSSRDIEIIDERLDVFKGRIDRDDWVTQASRLRRQPEAARMPTDL